MKKRYEAPAILYEGDARRLWACIEQPRAAEADASERPSRDELLDALERMWGDERKGEPC